MAQEVTVGNSGNKSVPTIRIGVSGMDKKVTEGWIGTGSGNKQFFAGLELSVSPAGASASGTTQTNTVVLTRANGKTPYSGAWSKVSGSDLITLVELTETSARWTVGSVTNASGVWKYTLTDAHGTTSFVNVGVTFDDGL